MTVKDTFTIPSHHNIYNGSNERNLRIDYAISENGTNENTGIFIFVPGFGGNIDSNVYKKMREQFTEKYNVVTVQCDYFGNRFMQGASNIKIKNFNEFERIFTKEEINKINKDKSSLLSIVQNYNLTLPVVAAIDENENEFVDMGYMQAIDILTTIEAIKIILKENHINFNENRIIGFGSSHGAYLLHLANRLAPHLFSLIIDNSAWVEPLYLQSNRILYLKFGNATLGIEFDYIAKSIIKDKPSLSLHQLYKNFTNESYIYSCVGTTDNLVDIEDKRNALSGLNNIMFEVVDSKKVDGSIFKSTNHSLDADFLNLIDYVLTIIPQNHVNKNKKQMKYEVTSSKTRILVDYSFGLPVFSID